MAYDFRKAFKTRWYYRVLEPGIVTPDSFMHVIERPAPEWPICDVITARFSRDVPPDTAQKMADLATLSAVWQTSFRELVQRG